MLVDNSIAHPYFDPIVWYMVSAAMHGVGPYKVPTYGNGHSHGNRYGNSYGCGVLLSHYGDGQGYGDGVGGAFGRGTGYLRLRYAQYF